MSAQLAEAADRLTLIAGQLAALLGDRARSDRAGPAPIVVPLGQADTLDVARDASARLRPHALVHLAPESVLVGPWGAAPAGPRACGHCLAMRWQQIRPELQREALEFGGPSTSAGDWPVLTPYLTDTIWSLYRAVTARQAGRPPTHGGSLVSQIDLRTLRTRTVPVIADPLCPGCHGERGHTDVAAPGLLAAQPKPSPESYRARQPSSYPLPAGGLVNPVCGVLGPRTVPQLESPATAPVLGRIMKQGRGRQGRAGLSEMMWSGQAGSYRASRDVALLEGLERYASAQPRRAGAVVKASYESIRDIALDPRSCGLYARETYQADPLLVPFDEGRKIRWVWGYSLTGRRPVLVPLQLAYYSAVSSQETYVLESSSGCASGASLPEATLFGLLELVERDAFLLGWYGGASLAEIDITAGTSPATRSMLDRTRLLGYDMRVYDNRVDLDIPVITCVAVRADHGDGAVAFAAGASLDPGQALLAAMSEVLSHLPALPSIVHRRRGELRAMAADFTRVTELRDHAELFALPEMAVHAHRYLSPASVQSMAEVYASWQLRRPRTTNLLDDLRHCQSEVERAGLEVIVVDQTCAEQRAAGLHTARVIVPGLLPIDFGWSRQRALTMPRLASAFRRAGWRAADLTATDLHLVPHPFP